MNVTAGFSFHLGSAFFSGLASIIPPPVYKLSLQFQSPASPLVLLLGRVRLLGRPPQRAFQQVEK